jgi:hypothetical protein
MARYCTLLCKSLITGHRIIVKKQWVTFVCLTGQNQWPFSQTLLWLSDGQKVVINHRNNRKNTFDWLIGNNRNLFQISFSCGHWHYPRIRLPFWTLCIVTCKTFEANESWLSNVQFCPHSLKNKCVFGNEIQLSSALWIFFFFYHYPRICLTFWEHSWTINSYQIVFHHIGDFWL